MPQCRPENKSSAVTHRAHCRLVFGAAAGGADLRAEAEHGLRVWAPLANRLGVWGLKAELEDLCFLVGL
jgi:hypothetical protein